MIRRSAAEIDELYENKVPAWRWKNTVTEVEKQLQAALSVRAGDKSVLHELHPTV
jgi:hypothetical protein